MINHPLPISTKVRTNIPACACTGRKFDIITGIIVKSEVRDNNNWYFINGRWVKDDWVLEVLK